jgi:hypothetical protein
MEVQTPAKGSETLENVTQRYNILEKTRIFNKHIVFQLGK